MSGRTWSRAAAVVLALALPVVPAMPMMSAHAGGHSAAAAAHGSDDDKGSKSEKKSKADKKNKASKKAKKAKKLKKDFNLGGSLTIVDVAANSVTFRVHGGKEKVLRGNALTVVVADGARVSRNDAPANLADFVVGDKVRAKGVRTEGVWTANRLKAEAPDWDDSTNDD